MPTIYFTGKGDDGTTGVLSGVRISKSDRLIAAIGDIDELNSSIGVALSEIEDESLKDRLKSVQNDLFVIGADLASAGNKKIGEAPGKHEAVMRLESWITELSGKTPDLKKFVLPGGSRESSCLHMSRAIARRAERSVIAASKDHNIDRGIIAYLNRLSSYLFAAAVYLNHAKGIKESNPTY
ncbi:MAG: cob(I)yrinic acid a,c-diamide adenosyltransferase [Candidatus Micrarchaeaceae archaeon]